MGENIPFVHCFKTPGGYYIYDVNKNVIIKLQKTVWENLKDMQSNSYILKSENSLIEKMLKDGFLSSKKIKSIVHPADDIFVYYLDRKIKMITLQVTQQCNLRCDYCVYSGGYENRTHSKKSMDFEMAKRCIDFYIEHSVESEFIIVGFYGGEPLIEFELIQKCISYIESISEGKKLMFTITTNGTLLNEKNIRFLAEHDVVMRISLDGPREIHDRSRRFAFNDCGTFDKVMENIEILRKNYPDYYKKLSFSTVLDQENDLSCISNFFADYETIKDVKVFTSEIGDNYAKSEVSQTEEYRCKLGYEHFKALLSKITAFDEKYISKIVANDYTSLERVYYQLRPSEGLAEKLHHGGPCIPGTLRLFVNTDGDMFPCERVSETSEIMKIGNVNTGFNLEKVRKLLNVGAISEDKCKNCWAFRFCILCCASADTGSELSGEVKTEKCHGVRNMAESNLKDICTLKENNFDFENNNWFVTA
jgi:uncharacterized protein